MAAKACLRQFLGCCAATLLETEFHRKQIDYNAAILAKDRERTIR